MLFLCWYTVHDWYEDVAYIYFYIFIVFITLPGADLAILCLNMASNVENPRRAIFRIFLKNNFLYHFYAYLVWKVTIMPVKYYWRQIKTYRTMVRTFSLLWTVKKLSWIFSICTLYVQTNNRTNVLNFIFYIFFLKAKKSKTQL